MRDGNDVFILTRETEIRELRSAGWRVRVDDDRTRTLTLTGATETRGMQTATYRGGYRTVSEIRTLLEYPRLEYLQLAELFEYGASWERVVGGPGSGHALFGIRLTNRSRGGPPTTRSQLWPYSKSSASWGYSETRVSRSVRISETCDSRRDRLPSGSLWSRLRR